MKFNSASCMEERCLSRGIPCMEFAVESKVKHLIGTHRPTAKTNIKIKPVSAKHFFQLTRRKDHEGYMWIPRVLNNNCTNKDCSDRSHVVKWCANTTSNMAHKDFDKFMSAKPEYTKEALLKRVPPEYNLIIEVFMKSNADIVAEHQEK